MCSSLESKSIHVSVNLALFFSRSQVPKMTDLDSSDEHISGIRS